MHAHPRLSGRADAVVRVHLREFVGGLLAEHSIDLRLRVVADPADHADRVRELVLAKAAKVLLRIKGALEGTAGEPAPGVQPDNQDDDEVQATLPVEE